MSFTYHIKSLGLRSFREKVCRECPGGMRSDSLVRLVLCVHVQSASSLQDRDVGVGCEARVFDPFPDFSGRV